MAIPGLAGWRLGEGNPLTSLVNVRAFVAIATPQLDRAVAFYQALLGQAPAPYQPERYAEFRMGELKLALFQPKPERLPDFAQSHPGAMSVCLEVPDLAAAITIVTDLGYPPPGDIITASHGQEVYAYDPDGNRLILHQSANLET